MDFVDMEVVHDWLFSILEAMDVSICAEERAVSDVVSSLSEDTSLFGDIDSDDDGIKADEVCKGGGANGV
jgi:hypothetical protein